MRKERCAQLRDEWRPRTALSLSDCDVSHDVMLVRPCNARLAVSNQEQEQEMYFYVESSYSAIIQSNLIQISNLSKSMSAQPSSAAMAMLARVACLRSARANVDVCNGVDVDEGSSRLSGGSG